MLSKLVLLSLIPAVAIGHTLSDAPVTTGICDSTVKQHSGYFHVDSGVDKNYFFWLFESRATPSTDPLIMWLNVRINRCWSRLLFLPAIFSNDLFLESCSSSPIQ